MTEDQPHDRRAPPPTVAGMLWELISGELTKNESRVLRQALGRIVFRTLVILHILWAGGWLAWVGLGAGFVRADESKTVVEITVDRAVAPLREEVFKLAAEQRKAQRELVATSEQVRAGLQLQLEARLREFARERCSTTDAGRKERLNAEIATLQQQYQKVEPSSGRYPIPRCEDLQ
jgi:hypothetical protein